MEVLDRNEELKRLLNLVKLSKGNEVILNTCKNCDSVLSERMKKRTVDLKEIKRIRVWNSILKSQDSDYSVPEIEIIGNYIKINGIQIIVQDFSFNDSILYNTTPLLFIFDELGNSRKIDSQTILYLANLMPGGDLDEKFSVLSELLDYPVDDLIYLYNFPNEEIYIEDLFKAEPNDNIIAEKISFLDKFKKIMSEFLFLKK